MDRASISSPKQSPLPEEDALQTENETASDEKRADPHDHTRAPETGLVAPLHELRGASREQDRLGNNDGASRIVEVKDKVEISKALGLNAQSNHGPGLPTALCLGGKFVLVGTSRGLVLVFDCFEELRMILGHGKQIRSMADPVLGKLPAVVTLTCRQV